MKEQMSKINPPENKEWEEKDNFEKKPEVKITSIIDKITEKATETVGIIKDEAKTVAPEILETAKKSSERLNKKNRIFEAVPNDVLAFGLVFIGSVIVAKKLL